MAALVAVVAVSGMSVAYGLSVSSSWAGFTYTTEDGTEQAFFWNPNNHDITHIDPEKDFTVERDGNWSIISHSGSFLIHDYFVNGTRAYLVPGEFLPPIVWLDEQATKTQKYLKLHTSQIQDLQDKNAQFEKKLASQAKRIMALEKQLAPAPIENLPQG